MSTCGPALRSAAAATYPPISLSIHTFVARRAYLARDRLARVQSSPLMTHE